MALIFSNAVKYRKPISIYFTVTIIVRRSSYDIRLSALTKI